MKKYYTYTNDFHSGNPNMMFDRYLKIFNMVRKTLKNNF